jgi:hypothetical protein
MKRLLSIVALLGLSGLGVNLAAQQSPQSPSTADQAGSTTQQAQTDASNPQQAARSFEGKIAKSGDKLVLQEASTQTAYQLDDQDKAKQFQGKNVTVMATLDNSTNTLHVVDINPAAK